MNKYNDIEIHPPLSSAAEERRYLLSCGGQYYEASRPIVDLVEELQRHETEEEAIAAYVARRNGKYTPEQVRQIIDKFVAPLFAPKAPKRSFLYEKELFSAAAIDWFSDRFRFLFHPACMLVVLGLALGMDLWFFLTTHDLLLFNNKVDIYMVVGLLAFMLGFYEPGAHIELLQILMHNFQRKDWVDTLFAAETEDQFYDAVMDMEWWHD